jgi:hypothetical protein
MVLIKYFNQQLKNYTRVNNNKQYKQFIVYCSSVDLADLNR